MPRLIKPGIIPSYNIMGKPFAYAWAPALEAFGLTKQDLLEFIYKWNYVMIHDSEWEAVSVIADAVDVVGNCDPTPATGIISLILKGIAEVAIMVSVVRRIVKRKRLLPDGNKEVFGPRGLSIQLVDEELREEQTALWPL